MYCKKQNSRKEPVAKIQNLAEKFNVCMVCVIVLQSLQIFYIIVLRAEIATTTYGSKMVAISTRNKKI